MQNKIIFSFENLFKKNTPAWIKRVANSAVIACIFAMGYSFLQNFPKVAITFLIIAAIAKFVSECFGQDGYTDKSGSV